MAQTWHEQDNLALLLILVWLHSYDKPCFAYLHNVCSSYSTTTGEHTAPTINQLNRAEKAGVACRACLQGPQLLVYGSRREPSQHGHSLCEVLGCIALLQQLHKAAL